MDHFTSKRLKFIGRLKISDQFHCLVSFLSLFASGVSESVASPKHHISHKAKSQEWRAGELFVFVPRHLSAHIMTYTQRARA
jgi:hypothetical protein